MLAERGIEAEYGGHVLQLLLPRDRFAAHPEYFPCGEDGRRMESGNLCVSNRAALELVRAGALGYVRDNPEMAMLHIWGADVRRGAWCRCAECAALSPQLQYMKVVNEIAAALASKAMRRRRSPISPITTRWSRIPRCARSTTYGSNGRRASDATAMRSTIRLAP